MKLVLLYIKIFLIASHTLFCAILGSILTVFIGVNRAIYITSQIWSFFLLKICGVTLNIKGEDKIIKTNRVYISNHASLIDIPIVFYTIPVPLFFMAKKELKRIPFFGWYMTFAGMIFIDRKNIESAKKSLLEAGKKIRKGKNIIVFPEGTRSETGKIKKFKKGAFYIAFENNIPITPVVISGTDKIIPKGKLDIKKGKVDVLFCDEILPEDFNSVEELSTFCQQTMKNTHETMIVS